jgi:hypothetical protein
MKSAITLTTPPPLPTVPVPPYDIILAGAFILLTIFAFRRLISLFAEEKANWRMFWKCFYLTLMPACFFISRVLPGGFGQFFRDIVDLFVFIPLVYIFTFYFARFGLGLLATLPDSSDDKPYNEYHPYTDKTRRYRV